MKSDETINFKLESGLDVTATKDYVTVARASEELFTITESVKIKEIKPTDRINLNDGSFIALY